MEQERNRSMMEVGGKGICDAEHAKRSKRPKPKHIDAEIRNESLDQSGSRVLIVDGGVVCGGQIDHGSTSTR